MLAALEAVDLVVLFEQDTPLDLIGRVRPKVLVKGADYRIDEVPWKPKLLTKPPVIENGEFILPTGPGWGTDVDEDMLRKHAAKMQ